MHNGPEDPDEFTFAGGISNLNATPVMVDGADLSVLPGAWGI